MSGDSKTNAAGSVPRLVLAIRRVVWAVGIIPVMLAIAIICIGGLVVGACWILVMWISGSRGEHDIPFITAMGAVELIWQKWNQLIEEPVCE